MKPHALRVKYGAVLIGLVLVAVSFSAVHAAPLVNNSQLDATQAGSQESNLGDLVADAIRDSGRADAALLPASELRSVTIPPGHIDSQQLVDALRAASDDSDTVVLVRLTGSQIKKALTHGLSRLPAPYDGFLQVSGLRVTYATGDHGAMVSSITLSGSSSELSDSQTYTVATSRLLADGALGYFEIWGKNDISRDTGTPLSKALVDFVTAHQPLDYHTDGRVSAR